MNRQIPVKNDHPQTSLAGSKNLDSFHSFEYHQLPVDYVVGQCLRVNLAHRLCNSVKNWLGLG